jgi:hypothetical protein
MALYSDLRQVVSISPLLSHTTHLMSRDLGFSRRFVFVISSIKALQGRLVRLTNFTELLHMTPCGIKIDFRDLEGGTKACK